MKKNFSELALKMHEENGGKVSIQSKVKVKCKDDLSTAYTPGVAEPCLKIKENKDDVYKYTCKSNMVAVVSDGTAVLGLGNIGASASIPVYMTPLSFIISLQTNFSMSSSLKGAFISIINYLLYNHLLMSSTVTIYVNYNRKSCYMSWKSFNIYSKGCCISSKSLRSNAKIVDFFKHFSF